MGLGSLLAKFGKSLGEGSILGQATEGLGVLSTLAETGAKASWRAGMKPAGKALSPYKMRATAVGGAALGSATLLGFAGVGPLSKIGSEYERAMTSTYGDNEDTQRVMKIQQFAAGVGGVGLAAVAGFGAFGKGPAGFSKNQTVQGSLKNVGAKLGNVYDKLSDPEAFKNVSGYSWAKNYTFSNKKFVGPPKPPGRLKKMFNEATSGYNVDFKDLGNPDNFYLKKPLRWGMGAGFVMGAGASMSEVIQEPNYGGYEGNIQGINSSQGGGISPELQFSTQGLMFSLHNNNKNSRARYR